MTTISRSPSPKPLESQVGGHPGVMESEDGSLIIKPALPVEVDFYQTMLTDPSLMPLRGYIPRFYGTLRLEGQVDEEQSAFGQISIKQEAVPAVERDRSIIANCVIIGLTRRGLAHSIVLENISRGFAKPNILDIKLGTVLYDEDASDEKRARMEKVARETTSYETGVRLTGFQVGEPTFTIH